MLRANGGENSIVWTDHFGDLGNFASSVGTHFTDKELSLAEDLHSNHLGDAKDCVVAFGSFDGLLVAVKNFIKKIFDRGFTK